MLPARREHAAKILECVFVRLQQRLLRGMPIRSMECVAGGHAPHCEDVQLSRFSAEFHRGFIPVQLRFRAQSIALRNEYFGSRQTQFVLALAHVASHLRFGNLLLRMLTPQPRPNPMCRVSLLAWRFSVRRQNLIDVVPYPAQLGPPNPLVA